MKNPRPPSRWPTGLLNLMSGKLPAMQAFTTGKLKIEGDLMKSQLIEKLFKFFFFFMLKFWLGVLEYWISEFGVQANTPALHTPDYKEIFLWLPVSRQSRHHRHGPAPASGTLGHGGGRIDGEAFEMPGRLRHRPDDIQRWLGTCMDEINVQERPAPVHDPPSALHPVTRVENFCAAAPSPSGARSTPWPPGPTTSAGMG